VGWKENRAQNGGHWLSESGKKVALGLINMEDRPMMFEEWYEKVKEVAKARHCLWLISNDPEDHREGYEIGNTPEEELEEQKYAAM